MKKIAAIVLALCLIVPIGFGVFTSRKVEAEEPELIVVTEGGNYDVVVYGATSAGVTAAIAAKREGASVILIAQNELIGGLTSSGLGATDMANKKVVGGISYEFYNRIYEYYLDDSAWTSQTRDEYFEELGKDIYSGKDDTLRMQWVFEPHVAEQVFRDMLAEDGVPVIFNERIDLENGVKMNGTRIESIVTESGKEFGAKVFIDCGYEGDLMAEAGVTYRTGREANSEYDETMNGILPNNNEIELTSPWIVEGDPDSGLLPFIEDDKLGETGEADGRAQAYCFRFTLSTDPDNRLPITKPENYHPEWYETRARMFLENPELGNELTLSKMPNNKTDTNHADFVGMSYEYADGDYLSRMNIEDDHRDYVLGLLYFYAYDERVPLNVREQMREYGLALDEFEENGNFPVNIYLREGRRMVSDYVMKESDVITQSIPGEITKTTAPHSVGQGFYWFDSHRVAYYIYNIGEDGSESGFQTDGNFWKSRRDYPISYESIRPKKEECVNLYVPVCLSSTHAAYGSIRMETTYMIVAESAGTAAAMSVKEMEQNADFAVQDLNYAKLAVKLADNGQLLGDIVADDLSAGDLAVLRLNVQGIIDADTANLLYTGMESGFNTPELVTAVRDTMYAAAKRIDKNAELNETLKVLSKYAIVSNTAEWEPLFSDTLPVSLSKANVTGVFTAIANFFVNESPEGYITDWVNYFYEHDIIDAEMRDYFDDNAIKGKSCETLKTQKLLVALAKTMDPNVKETDAALQVYVSIGAIGNTAAWTGIFDGTAASVSGDNLNSLLKKVYAYMLSNESSWAGRIGTATLDYLISKGILDGENADLYSELLKGTADGSTVSAASASALIVNGAKYFDPSATAETAKTVLSGKGVDITPIEGALTGTDANGADMRKFLTDLKAAIIANPITEPLTSDDLAQVVSLGILTQEQAQYFIDNAVFAGTTDKAQLSDFLSKISSRIVIEGTTYSEKLFNAGVIDENQKAVLERDETVVAGDVANQIIRNTVAYVKENNVALSADYIKFLQDKGIVTAEDNLSVISTFGFVPKTLGQKIFIGLAEYIDPSVSEDINAAIDLFADINAVTNAQSWKDSFASASETLYGNDFLNVINIVCKFTEKDGTFEDYKYLADNSYISSEDMIYYIRHANNGNTAERAKIVALIEVLGKAMDTDGSVTDGLTAIAEIKANGVISNDTAWVNIVNSQEETIKVQDVINLVDKSVAKIKTMEGSGGDVVYLTDEVLNYFTEKQFIGVSGIPDKEYYRSHANSANTDPISQSGTQSMLTRAFRAVTGAGTNVSAAAISKYIDESDFKFSDDETEDATVRAYWYNFLKNKGVVDGEMLRVLMTRIYDYMNSGV